MSRYKYAAVLFLGVGVLFSLAFASQDPPARLLTDAELSAVFGDGNFECKTKDCNFHTAAGSKCTWCDSTSDRVLCCSGGDDDCEYTGDLVCTGATFWEATTSGTPGSCGSCTTGGMFVENGQCNDTKNAVCTEG